MYCMCQHCKVHLSGKHDFQIITGPKASKTVGIQLLFNSALRCQLFLIPMWEVQAPMAAWNRPGTECKGTGVNANWDRISPVVPLLHNPRLSGLTSMLWLVTHAMMREENFFDHYVLCYVPVILQILLGTCLYRIQHKVNWVISRKITICLCKSESICIVYLFRK